MTNKPEQTILAGYNVKRRSDLVRVESLGAVAENTALVTAVVALSHGRGHTAPGDDKPADPAGV